MKSGRHSRMEGSGTVTSLQELIASIDRATLPRILQVCSGVYFQGSVYELSGSEVCLSTGDLVKVIDLKLLSASCTDISSNSTYELPIDHKGLFKVVAEDMAYSSVEEMVGLLPVGVDVVGSFSFVTRSQLTVGNFSMAPGQVLTLLSSDQGYARCQVTGPEGSKVEVRIPLSQAGLFYECQSEHGYSLRQILSSERLRSRRFRSVTSKSCGGPLLFSPIYQIEAIMHMRKNIVNFPSSLEVDVVDVTETSQHIEFVKPLTLPEVCAQHPHPPQGGDAAAAAGTIFPVVAEILEAPEASRHFFQCEWHPRLQKGARLVLHGHGERSMVLASTPQGRKARQYFLLQSEYAGRLRRKAREFGSVYELYVAASRVGGGGGSVGGGKGVKKGGGVGEGLRVSATRNCEAVEEEGLPELEVGEQLEVLRCEPVELPGTGEGGKAKQRVEALLCRRIQEDDDDDDDDDEEVEDDEDKGGKGHSKADLVHLPLFMGAQFMEVISDKRKYSLAELGKGFSLPLDVKVASRDPDLEKDPLPGLPVLRLEEMAVEPCVRASLLEKPHLCFELPTNWLHMSVSFTSEPLPWPRERAPRLCLETVTEVKEQFYYEFRKLTTNQEAAPPPRPPKRATSQEPTAKPKPLAKSTRDRERGRDRDMKKDTPPELGKKTRSMSTSLCQLSLDSGRQKRNPPPPPTPTESAVDEPPPIIPRKPEAHRVSSTVPNTYVRGPKKKKDKTRGRCDSDSEHDYETVEDMVRNAQESVMFY